MKLKVNDIAPNFCLVSTELKEVCLTDFKGTNLMVLFFPLAFSGVCTIEMNQLKDDWAAYTDLGVTVLAISVDSPFSLKSFKESIDVDIIFLSDFNKTTSGAYGVLNQAFALGLQGVANRAAFLIDATGRIKYVEVLENPKDLPNFAAIKNVIASLNS